MEATRVSPAPVVPMTSVKEVKSVPASSPPGGTSAASVTSPPIKLRIRRSFQQEHMIVPEPAPAAPTSPASSAPIAGTDGGGSGAVASAVPTANTTQTSPARVGRTKTKQDIMKQLMEKKRGRKLLGGSTAAETTATTPVSSPHASPQQFIAERTNEKPVKWLVGDLMWAKVSGHPWWPCMVAYDPFQGIYTKMKGGPNRATRLYHVQFFGDAVERGWVAEGSTLPFEGREAFDAYCEEMVTKYPKDRDRYRVRPSRRRAWEIAVADIQFAFGMTRTERKQRYTFVYEQPVTVSGGAAVPGNGTPRPRGRPPKRKAVEEAATEERSPPQKRRRQNKSRSEDAPNGYTAFCAQRRGDLVAAYPDDSGPQIDERLCALWDTLSDTEKSGYVVERVKLAEVVQRSGRVSKPSQKKLEAAEESFEVHRHRKSLSSPQPLRTEEASPLSPKLETSVPKHRGRPRKHAADSETKLPTDEANAQETSESADPPEKLRKTARRKSVPETPVAANDSEAVKIKVEENVENRTKTSRKKSVAEVDTVEGSDLVPAKTQVEENAEKRMKTSRKKSVAEGDAVVASDSASAKVKVEENAEKRLKTSRKKSVAEADAAEGSDSSSAKTNVEETKDTAEKRMKTSRKKSVAEGDAVDSSDSASAKVKVEENAEKRLKTSRKKSVVEADAAEGSDSSSAKMNVEEEDRDAKRMKASRKKSVVEADTVDSSDSVPSKVKPEGTPVVPPSGQVTLEIQRLSSAGPARREDVCALCERPADQNLAIVTCTGACATSYHPSCLGLSTVGESFTCDECVTDCHTCFACKKSSADTRRCAAPLCGRFYHPTCLSNLPMARPDNNNHHYCPLHTCATCALDGPKNSKATKGRMYKCVRCPTAYHVGDFCVAAGSLPLAGFNIVCSAHFSPLKSHAHHTHVNVNWCFLCSQGGSLLCCDACPAAFHAECLGLTSAPEGSWHCKDCKAGRRPLYGDIVWVKVGNYRWWPGEVCHMRNVPQNIQEKPHGIGEFPVHFFGSNDYYWTHQARLFLFQEGDKGSRDTTPAKGLAKLFQRAVREATEAFKIWTHSKEKKEEQQQERSDRKPAPYKHIKTNLPVGNVQIHRADVSEIPRCECSGEGATCFSDTDCINRMLFYECHAAACAGGDRCHNQRFQRREYPPTRIMKVEGRGWGLHTLVDIRKGQFVNEYVGDLVDEEECKRRIRQAHVDNITNFYMLTVDKNRIIDAGPKGNYSRFMNHSCEPNCETQKWMVNGDIRVGLFAICDISAGSELTFNYNLDCLGNEKRVCRCEASNCSGFLGVRPKTAAAAESEKRAREAKARRKKKKATDTKKEHEDECFRCGEGGELVMCDRTHCSKVYHLKCLKLSKPPSGKWLCPWHHCDTCGQAARLFCSVCPNSYCVAHAPSCMTTQPSGPQLCDDHSDITSSSSGVVTPASSDDGKTSTCRVNGDVTSDVTSVETKTTKAEQNGKPATAAADNGCRTNQQSRSDTNSPMFDDNDDDDDFPELVIDIPM